MTLCISNRGAQFGLEAVEKSLEILHHLNTKSNNPTTCKIDKLLIWLYRPALQNKANNVNAIKTVGGGQQLKNVNVL